jgi:hypothetical protein
MTILTTSRALAAACFGLTMTAFAGVTCAADAAVTEQKASSLPVDGQQCATHASTELVGPDGHQFRLAYVPGYGCQYVLDGRSAVRVDGPNGYHFAWTRETGWRIVDAID